MCQDIKAFFYGIQRKLFFCISSDIGQGCFHAELQTADNALSNNGSTGNGGISAGKPDIPRGKYSHTGNFVEAFFTDSDKFHICGCF